MILSDHHYYLLSSADFYVIIVGMLSLVPGVGSIHFVPQLLGIYSKLPLLAQLFAEDGSTFPEESADMFLSLPDRLLFRRRPK